MNGIRSYLFETYKCSVLSRHFSLCTVRRAQIFNTVEEAVHDIPSDSKILIGGHGISGVPYNLINAVCKRNLENLTIVSNSPADDNFGVGSLLQKNQIKRVIASYIGENKEFLRRYLSGELEVELVPEGSLAEKIRAGGAGIPGFYTPTGMGTLVEEGGIPIKFNSNGSIALASEPKDVDVFRGRRSVLEEAIKGDFALIKAWKADKYGNLIFKKSTRNFNIPMCKAGKIAIAEVDEIVELGDLIPENVQVQSIYVQRVVIGDKFEDKIHKEQLKSNYENVIKAPITKTREKILRRAALEFEDNMYANLGNGMPELASDYIPSNINVNIQCENGILNVGPYALENELDTDLVNPFGLAVTALPGTSFFASDESFAMIRGGHLQMALLGGMQVSRFGDLANWMVPGKLVGGMRGAMDLVASRRRVVVTMEHTLKDGTPKIRDICSLPLTGKKCVNRIITEKGVFDVNKETGLTLIEIADGITIEEIRSCTACQFEVSQDLKPMGQIDIKE